MYPLTKRKRAAHSIVTVSVGGNLCLPACLHLGKYRQTHDVGGWDRDAWKNLTRAERKHLLEQKVTSELKANGLPVGTEYTLADADHIQRVLYPDYQIKVFSECDGGNIARSPEQKSKGMKEIYACLRLSTLESTVKHMTFLGGTRTPGMISSRLTEGIV